MIVNIDFNKKFSNEKDIEDDVDYIMSMFKQKIINEDNALSIDNPIKIKQMEFVHNVIKYMTNSSNVKVTYDIHKPFKSMGYIRVTGKNISFIDTKWFKTIAECASNVEMYTKTDGTVQIDFCFHEITSMV